MPTYFPHNEDDEVPRRRAGLRSDELLPGESNPEDSAGGINAAGTPGGGMAGGGLAGTNTGDGGYDDELEDAMSAGIRDHAGDKIDEGEPEAGPSGGAAGGTPAGKRSGPRLHDR
jgi:hypothetical protein